MKDTVNTGQIPNAHLSRSLPLPSYTELILYSSGLPPEY